MITQLASSASSGVTSLVPRRFFLSLLGAAALLFSACGGERAAEPAPRTHIIEISGMGFQPAELNARIGDTIVWVNRDLLAHTATDIASGWSSPSLAMGGRWQWVPTQAGAVRYRCAFHPVMEASILVSGGT